jgi:hypothetical protein
LEKYLAGHEALSAHLSFAGSAAAGLSFDRFRYRSICRMNILRKESSV